MLSEASMCEDQLPLGAEVRDEIVTKKVTCPFLGSAVHQELLCIRGDAVNRLAKIEDIRGLGNTGGGDLGNLLALFAEGNHALMRGDSGRTLEKQVPTGLFSLDLPGSQGSHPGHSGILEGDPTELDSGRLSIEDFHRLSTLARDGVIKRSDIGHFIAENLRRDPKSKITGASVAELLAHDLGAFVETVAPALIAGFVKSDERAAEATRTLEEKLTKLLGEDNLVGSAGEFGLLFAFLAHSPRTKEIEGEPALSIDEVKAMFVDKRLPDGWQTWKKSRADWVMHTTWLLVSADKEYRRLRRED
jgi:hypothetical protein